MGCVEKLARNGSPVCLCNWSDPCHIFLKGCLVLVSYIFSVVVCLGYGDEKQKYR